MSQSKEEYDLRKQWDRWIGVVKSVEAREKLQISGPRYAIVYEKILDICQGRVRSESSLPHRSRRLYRKINTVVEPWVSMETLRHSDRRILRDLLAQCQEINDQMHPHSIHVPRSMVFLLIGIVLVICWWFAVTFGTVEGVFVESIQGAAQKLQNRIVLAVRQSTVTQWLAVIAILVVLFGGSLTLGTRKS